jgi:hypothetical protein
MDYNLVTTADEEHAKSTAGLTRNPTGQFYKSHIQITNYEYTGNLLRLHLLRTEILMDPHLLTPLG